MTQGALCTLPVELSWKLWADSSRRIPSQRLCWLPSTFVDTKERNAELFSVVISKIFYFHPYLGKIPIFDEHIFQMGWNHQLVIDSGWILGITE